jgi:hypothetical protein
MELGPNGPIEPKLPWGPKLDARQRMAVAKLSGAVERYAYGDLAGAGDGLPVLLGYSSDPLVWGVILGSALRAVERGEGLKAGVVDYARRAGADEDAAQTHLTWLRAQLLL